eukprot:CAMPEP_0184711992 /NCGR_PEP_ID=MMETSP0314-20130426/2608_1 /TAXON_ID=38298 /ORGANISM="Rhodella maculata, Strain CCMP 736" /LENGTH=271 /DNA_ID=CAMNT_0027174313 /DNA_START=31 /DNA_END=843 /DNA_ORIENTATION=+
MVDNVPALTVETAVAEPWIGDTARDLIAGSFAGVAQLVVGHPFDTIKVKLQNMPTPLPGQPPLYTGALDATRQTIAAHGPLALFRGMSAPFAFVSLFNALLFATYGASQKAARALRATPPEAPLPLADHFACGFATGAVATAISAPTELLKCRLQADPAAFRGPVDVARAVLRAEGLRGLARGGAATFLREAPGSAFYFGVYNTVKGALATEGHDGVRRTSGVALLAAGAAGGGAYWGVTYPVDLIKTKIQTDGARGAARRYTGIVDVGRR